MFLPVPRCGAVRLERLVSLCAGGPRQAGVKSAGVNVLCDARSAVDFSDAALAARPGRAARDRSGLARRHRFAQHLVEHLGAGLRAVADRRRHLRADRAGIGLASAKAADVPDRRRSGGDRFGGADLAAGRTALSGADRQQDQHQAEPERHAQQEEHDDPHPRRPALPHVSCNLAGTLESAVGGAGTFFLIIEQNMSQIFAQVEKIEFT